MLFRSLLVDIASRPRDMANAERALHDYLDIITTEKLKSKQGNDPSELKELAEKLRQSKGYGRKENGKQ